MPGKIRVTKLPGTPSTWSLEFYFYGNPDDTVILFVGAPDRAGLATPFGTLHITLDTAVPVASAGGSQTIEFALVKVPVEPKERSMG